MKVHVVIATCGSSEWSDLAWSRAYPSANAQEPRPGIAIEHYPRLSVARARNAAARTTPPGCWLCFLDADDELEPGYLAAMAAANGGWEWPQLETPWTSAPPPLLVPALRRVPASGAAGRAGIPNSGSWPRLNECVVGTLIHRHLFFRLGGFRDLASLEDYDLFLRAFDAGAQLAYVRDAVYREHVSADGRNRDQSPYASIWADHLARISA